MQFLLNDKLTDEPDLPADLTVLDYLREHCKLTGTKEGCASGDCGACTVVVASLSGDQLVYRSLNSCIALIGDMHGKQLITVEHLADNGKLHPVQQAMVDHHASQCGFCTPGFVMSAFALTKNAGSVDIKKPRKTIERHLGGNLCRCTGYRPIVDAAAQALTWAVNDGCDQFSESQQSVIAQLQAIQPSLSDTRFHQPTTLVELLELKAAYPQAPLVGGCTDFSLEVTQRLRQFDRLISTKCVNELDYITLENGKWRIGSGCTIEHLLNTLGPLNSSVKHMLLRFGASQVRNQATVGGNLGNASPIADLPPMFLALNASVILASAGAGAGAGASSSVIGRRVISLQDYFIDYKKTVLQPDEIIAELQFDQRTLQQDNSCFRIYKISKRADDDISTVCAAFSFAKSAQGTDVFTAAFGGMAAIPKRAIALEQLVNNAASSGCSDQQIARALESDFQPISDARASAAYRHSVACNLYQKFMQQVAAGASDTLVYDYE